MMVKFIQSAKEPQAYESRTQYMTSSEIAQSKDEALFKQNRTYETGYGMRIRMVIGYTEAGSIMVCR